MMLSTLLLPQGGVKVSSRIHRQFVKFAIIKSIKTIKTQKHHNNQVTQAIRGASLDYYSISRPLQKDKRRVPKLHRTNIVFIKNRSNVP